MRRSRAIAAASIAVALLLSACSSAPPGPPTVAPGVATPVGTAAGPATELPGAGDACEFVTAEAVGGIMGIAPVEVAERAGRADCDYWLDAAKTSKVNIGVTTGPDGAALFESTKALGEPAPVAIGDDAYTVALQGLGTVLMVKSGDAVVSVQVLTDKDPADQLARARAVAEAVIAGL